MERKVEAYLPSKYESKVIDQGDDGRPLASASKEEGIVTVNEIGIPPVDGGMRAWLVLAGVSSSVVYICFTKLISYADILS